MKTSVILICFVGLQSIKYGTEAQLFEMDEPPRYRHTHNVNKIYDTLLRGAMNLRLIRRKPAPLRPKVSHNEWQERQVKQFPRFNPYGAGDTMGAGTRNYNFLDDSRELRNNHDLDIGASEDQKRWWNLRPPPSNSYDHINKQQGNSYNNRPSVSAESYQGPPPTQEQSYQSYGPPATPSHTEKSPQTSYGPPSTNPQPYGPPEINQGWGWGSPQRTQQCEKAPPEIIKVTKDFVLPPGWRFESPKGNPISMNDVNLENIPYPPPVIRIGIKEPIPENYTVTYFEKIEVIKPPTSGPVQTVYDFKIEAHHNNEKKPASTTLLNINDKPKPNSLQVFTQVIRSPNISAPLYGYDPKNGPDHDFSTGLKVREIAFRKRTKEHPFQYQIRILGEVFNQIQAIEKKPAPVSSKANSGSFGSTEIEAPILVYQIQRFTIGDPDSSEKTILDSQYNFGLPAAQFEFGDLSAIKDSWEASRNAPEELSVNQLGSSGQEIGDTFRDWVKAYVRNGRTILGTSYNRAEMQAFEGFDQYQYFINRPAQCPAIVDPTHAGGSASLACANSNQRAGGPPPPPPSG